MIPSAHRPRIGEILLDAGALTERQMDDGLREQRSTGERLGRCLVRLGHLREEALLEALGRQLGLEVIELGRLKVPDEATRALPLDFVRRHRILPLAVTNGALRIATSNPVDPRLIEDVRLLSGLEVEEALAPEREICDKISECYQITVERMVEDLRASSGAEAAGGDLHDIEVMASEPTVVNLVNLVISTALKERASDIHLVPFERSLELRYRVDGLLRVMPPPPKHFHAALVSRVKIMANMNIAERYLPQDGHIQITHAGHRVDIRVGTMPTLYGESLVMRLLEKGARVKTLEELGMDGARVARLAHLVEKPHGIFLATGPTGSGKTTTLYSILSTIYAPEKKFLTLEDPVEYELPGVAQIPVNPKRNFTFASGLRSILRQDPDVIMVGEIRDSETAEIAIRAALTGHLVFSTLHTNDSAGAITRLIDMGIEPFLIASSLEGVLAQRLIRRICPACKEPVELGAELVATLGAFGVHPGAATYFRGAGCEECRGTGYLGRLALFELLVMAPELRERVVARQSSTEIKAAALEDMVTLRDDGLRKAAAGVTTMEEVLRVVLRESPEN
ncbi:MAG: Flp pilus assembly complex ATPase component TadA [Planctomycetes bacterium]|nr:Flp pilus assembly complex ATPase component TadA [Planctomycetota bacterium]